MQKQAGRTAAAGTQLAFELVLTPVQPCDSFPTSDCQQSVAEVLGGMNALAERTGLSRATLYRTLSEKGNPRLDTLAALLAAFGLRLAVQPIRKSRGRREAQAM
jgi:transcriptional regulator with XRE-family HTH domain